MITSLFINLWILSPWLIWNSYLLYYIHVDDKSFQFVITSKRQRFLYWFYLLIFLFIGVYIFLVRLSRITLSIDIYITLDIFQQIINSLSYWAILGIGLFFLLLMLFWMLLLRHLYTYLRKCLYSLYLYYYQYKVFRRIISLYNKTQSGFIWFLVRRVKLFTKNGNIIGNTLTIWPGCIFLIEKNLFRYLIPYLFIFDILTQNGQIYHIFQILPCYYIYSLLRSSSKLLDKFFISMDLSFVEMTYGLK